MTEIEQKFPTRKAAEAWAELQDERPLYIVRVAEAAGGFAFWVEDRKVYRANNEMGCKDKLIRTLEAS